MNRKRFRIDTETLSIHKIHIIVKYCSIILIRVKTEIKANGCPRGVMVKAVDCGIVVNNFEHQSHYYVFFRTNTLGKCMNFLIVPAMG